MQKTSSYVFDRIYEMPRLIWKIKDLKDPLCLETFLVILLASNLINRFFSFHYKTGQKNNFTSKKRSVDTSCTWTRKARFQLARKARWHVTTQARKAHWHVSPFLARNLADSVVYSRKDNFNHLVQNCKVSGLVSKFQNSAL